MSSFNTERQSWRGGQALRGSLAPAIAIFLLTSPALIVDQVHARDWYLEPGVSILAGYEDNPLLQAEVSDDASTAEVSDTSDGQSYVGIGADLSIHSASPSDSYIATLGAESRQYEDSELDTDLIDASMEYLKTLENSSYNLGVSYGESTTFETGFTDTDISLIGANLVQQTLGVSTGYTRQINTRLSSDFSAEYNDVGYESDSENLTEFVEYKQTSLSLDLVYSVTERLDLLSGLEFLMYRPDTDSDASAALDEDILAYTLGLDFAVRENLSAQISIAPTYRDIEGGEGAEGTEDTTSTQYDLGLTYTGFQNSFSAGFSRSLTPAASGGLIESDNYSVEWSRPNQYEGAFSAALTYGEQVDEEDDSGDISSFTFDTAYSRAFNRHFSWVVRYRYREQSSVDEGALDSNDISFQLQYNWGRIAIPGIDG